MIQLIADSGSTTTKWRLKNGASADTFYTAGLNPYFRRPKSVQQVIKHELLPKLPGDDVDEIHFYGSGCDGPKPRKMIRQSLQNIFNHSKITVEHDLLGSAQACFFHRPGIACILGTGSNSCLYDGRKIIEHIPTLGFIMGDEASAGYFGIKLINQYFREEIPPDLKEALEESFNMNLQHIMEHVYKGPQPNRFIASYAKFLGVHDDHPYVIDLLTKGFHNFTNRLLKNYTDAENLPLSFVGAVAFNHQSLIKQVLEEEGLTPGIFLKNPLDRLAEFHSN